MPPTQVLTGLALILTLFVMAPTGERMYHAVEPVLDLGAGSELLSGPSVNALGVAADRAKEPLREFLLKHADARDRALSSRPGAAPAHARRACRHHRSRSSSGRAGVRRVRAAAGIRDRLSPLRAVPGRRSGDRRDLLLALGMHMLSPTTVSLPFKLLLFVLADGWHLVIRGLVESYV